MSEGLSPGQEDANWKAPETGSVQPDTETKTEVISDPEQIKAILEEQYQLHHLLLHQTSAEIADHIVDKAEYFTTGPGIEGHVLMMDPKQISAILSELGKDRQDRVISTHKGADGAVIMAFPRSVIQGKIDSGEMDKDHGVSSIDEVLADKYSAGEITEIGLPNRFILGSYHDASFIPNPKYSPSFDIAPNSDLQV